MSILEAEFNNKLDKNFLFENKPLIVVAVSGGPDSIALVFLLKKWILKKKGQLIAIIIDHQIRKESYSEALFVKKYLELNKIKSLILRVSKNKVNKGKMSEARENRFSKMIKFCNNNNIFHLFIGHHYDDNIETFMLRKIAGSNFEGLNCMNYKTIMNNVQIIRPLLSFSKKKLLNYNNKKKLKYVLDPSNKNEKYSRVIVRNFLIKNKDYLIKAQKDFKLIRNNYYQYKKMIFQIFNLMNLGLYKNKIIIDKLKFLSLNEELQSKIIEINYKFLCPKRSFLRYKKILKVLELFNKKTIFSLNIGGMEITNHYNSINFIKKN